MAKESSSAKLRQLWDTIGCAVKRVGKDLTPEIHDEPIHEKEGSMKVLSEAREFVMEGRFTKEGVTCPCCDKYAKVYKRFISQAQLPFLKALYVLDKGHPGAFFKAGKDGEPALATPGGDYAKMEWWTLIERELIQRKDGSYRSGYWRITKNGIRFLEGTIRVPRFLYEYDGELLNPQPHLDSVEYVTVDFLDPEFNLQKIM